MRITRILARIAAAVLITVPSLAQATNGYFAHGFGIKNRAMAGVGTAYSQDAVAGAVNPAGMVHVGNRFDVALELFSPRRKFTVSGAPNPGASATQAPPVSFPLAPGTVESNREFFAIPTFGWNRMIDEQSSVGISVFAQGGMVTEFPAAVFGAGETGVDLAQIFVAPTYARRLNDRLSVGISPILAVQRFEAKGFGSFAPFSADPANLSNNGHEESFGAGLRLGLQGQLTPTLRAGVSWKSRLYMDEFDDYSGLFAEQGGFDIPESFNAGVAWRASPSWLLQFDLEHIRYSDIDSVGNSFLPNLVAARLGADGGAGFGWEDMTILKFGAQWQQNDQWTWRGGVSYGEQPIPDSEVLFNIVSPGVQEWHLTAGATYSLGDGSALDIGLMFSPENSVAGVNPLNTGQTVEIEMHQLAIQIGYSKQF